MKVKARFPANAVGTLRIAPYNSTSPNFKSTQYQKSRSSNAANRVVKGRIWVENRWGRLGEIVIHCGT